MFYSGYFLWLGQNACIAVASCLHMHDAVLTDTNNQWVAAGVTIDTEHGQAEI